jgi:site-specific recombinase XerD
MKNKLLRDPINEDVLIDLLTNLPSSKFNEKRNIISIILLYITGCRINELRNFNLLTINKFINSGTIMIHSYKTSTTRRIDISESEQLLLKNYEYLVKDLYNSLNPTDHILMTSKGKEINNQNAYILLNRVLRKYGDKHGLSILSHSFRIGYITELLRTHNVQVAKSMIGHKQIDTTLRYDRNMYTSADVKKIRDNLSSNKKLSHYLKLN